MFITDISNNEETREILQDIKNKFGFVPAHFELLASINPRRFELFMNEIDYLTNHKTINTDFFIFIRLYIANKEKFDYCRKFNTSLLLQKKYSQEIIRKVKNDIIDIPLDEKHKLLAKLAIKAIYESKAFGINDIKELKSFSWSDADIYDAIDHCAFLFKNARIIRAYLQ